MAYIKAKKTMAAEKLKIIPKADTSSFSILNKKGKPVFTVEVPNNMIEDLKKEHMSKTLVVYGGAYDEIKDYLLKNYGGSQRKNRYVYKVLKLVDEEAKNLAKEKAPKKIK